MLVTISKHENVTNKNLLHKECSFKLYKQSESKKMLKPHSSSDIFIHKQHKKMLMVPQKSNDYLLSQNFLKMVSCIKNHGPFHAGFFLETGMNRGSLSSRHQEL